MSIPSCSLTFVGARAIVFLASLAIPAGALANQDLSVTFAKDVLPILQRSCQNCHRPGTGAPMSLLTFEEARPWARAIKDRVVRRQMPPWHLDRSIGTYAPDPSLTDEEVGVIVRWVDQGAVEGNPTDAPPPIEFRSLSAWAFGEPDLVVEMKDGFAIPSEGADFYPFEIVDPGLTEDKYVKWAQLIPGAYCCVHHQHVYVVQPDGEPVPEGIGIGIGSNTGDSLDLVNYAMGQDGDYYPDGVTKVLKAGSLFRFAPHYHPWGEETHDRSKIGLKFYPEGVVPELIVTSHRMRTGVANIWDLNREGVEDLLLREGHELELDASRMPAGALIDDNTLNSALKLSIPPHTVAQHERFWPLPRPAMIISFQPHMHFRGRRMLLEAIHLDGRREVLTDVTDYEQSWQITYTYEKPLLFPKGTVLHVVSWHDNTANNRHNPDPSAWVGWGPRTMDEMGQGWTDVAFMTDEQYEARLAKTPTHRTTNEDGAP